MRDSGIELEDVGAVVMVGGSTRVPRVREAVAEAFGRQPLTEIDLIVVSPSALPSRPIPWLVTNVMAANCFCST